MRLWTMISGLDGRIGRREYWVGVLQSGLIQMVAFVLIVWLAMSELVPKAVLYGLAAALALFAAWVAAALNAKRLHDHDLSAHFVWPLVVLPSLLVLTQRPLLYVPGSILALIAFVVIGFLPGTVGSNRFGPDPLARP